MTISDKSSWRDASRPTPFPALKESLTVDVAIIGGGITGITAAYLLRKSGKSVALVEKGSIGQYATGSTTGFLMETIDTSATKLTERFGLPDAKSVTASHRNAISTIERIVTEEKIACEFIRCPAYTFTADKKEVETLQKEAAALQKLGTDASYHTDSKLPLQNAGYIEIKHQAKFHSLKYLFALAEICRTNGIQLFENTEVTSVDGDEHPVIHIKDGHTIQAKQVLMATHYPIDPQPLHLKFKKAWYTTYVLEAWVPSGTLPEAMYVDTALPYHYARIDTKEGRDRLIIGGEDHRSDLPVNEDKNFAALEAYTKDMLQDVAFEVTRKWKGRVVESGDGLAFIGPVDSSPVFYATGFSGTGLTYATIAAQAFTNKVLGKEDPYQKLYAADRPFSISKSFPKAVEYVEEFILGAVKNTLR